MRFKIQSRHSSPKRTLMKDLFYSGTYQKFELIKQCFDGLFVFSISIFIIFLWSRHWMFYLLCPSQSGCWHERPKMSLMVNFPWKVIPWIQLRRCSLFVFNWNIRLMIVSKWQIWLLPYGNQRADKQQNNILLVFFQLYKTHIMYMKHTTNIITRYTL